MRSALFSELCFLEGVVEAFAFSDAKRIADPLVVGPKAHQAADDRLVGAVAFAGARKGAMKLDRGFLWSATHQGTSQ